MKFCCVDAKGEITQVGTVPDTADAEVFSHFSDTVLTDIPESVDSNTHYVQQGEFIQFGEPPAFGVWDWLTYQWVIDLSAARAARAALISNACKAEILSGFSSSALGAAHHYPAKTTDQQNLASSVLASLLPIPADWTTPFWCADTSGVWAFRLHTAAQIQQVGQDAKAAILAAMGKNEVLQAQIAAAGSVEELEAIAW